MLLADGRAADPLSWVGALTTATEDPAVFLQKLRQSGIRIDREGHLWHDGERVVHEGLKQALFSWLSRESDGRYVFRLDAARFVYVDVDDTPLVVRGVRDAEEMAAGGMLLTLSDRAEETLDEETLTVDGEGGLRCRVRAGALEARFSTSALAGLAHRLQELQGQGDVLWLSARGWRPLPRR